MEYDAQPTLLYTTSALLSPTPCPLGHVHPQIMQVGQLIEFVSVLLFRLEQQSVGVESDDDCGSMNSLRFVQDNRKLWLLVDVLECAKTHSNKHK